MPGWRSGAYCRKPRYASFGAGPDSAGPAVRRLLHHEGASHPHGTGHVPSALMLRKIFRRSFEGKPSRNAWASSAILTTQFMLPVVPQLEPAFPDLLHSMTNSLRFRRRGHVLRINNPLRLDEHAVGVLAECDKIPFFDVEGLEHLARDYHLAALPHASKLQAHAALGKTTS